MQKREQLHKILDLILDINGMEMRKQGLTGNKPTAFLRYSGHVSTIEVDIHANGWKADCDPDYMEDTAYIDEEFADCPTLDEIVSKLETFKRGMNQTTTECSQCGQEGVQQDMLETARGILCEECIEE